jgi:secreted PhoX family phosphatase
MKIKRRTKIICETERKVSFVIERKTVRFFCADCDGQSEMLSINEAASRTEKAWREIVRLVENGTLHSSETDAGEIYVCAASLSDEKKFEQNGEKM